MKTLTTKAKKTQDLEQPYFLQEILENFEDGILILTESGELVHGNASAYNICNQINQCNLNSNCVPSVIWNLCKSLINTQTYCDNVTTITEDIIIDRRLIFRLRIRRLNLEVSEQPYLLVTIENRYESVQKIALCEANKYNLTNREAEIWSLYLAKFSYKQIAEQLYITVNTVKKHLKNIRAKKQRLYPV
ncbi:MAG: LuxR C-terminal-related transcriptional regulator [Cyanobacteria bacterium J06635_10]